MVDTKPSIDTSLPPPRPRRHIEDAHWGRKHYGELVQQYPDMWLAILNKEVVIASKDLGEVFTVARKKAAQVGQGPCYYTFVESPRRFRRPINVSDSS